MKLVLAFLFLFEAGAYAAAVKSKSGEVHFLAKGNPGFMKIEGKSSGGLTGELDPANTSAPGVFTFAMSELETGIELRDEHMKEKYLEVEKFPEAKLVLKNVAGLSAIDGNGKGSFSGTLTLHGVSRDVSGSYEIEGRKVKASFTTKISDYAINVPSWMGVTVADNVDVTVTSQF